MNRGFLISGLAVCSISLFLCFSGCSAQLEQDSSSVIFEEDFSRGLENWWVEGTDRVFIEDGKLYVNANGGGEEKDRQATIWCKKPVSAENVHIEFDAYVVTSKKKVNNINFFLNYTIPGKKNIYQTRNNRVSGDYSFYHDLNGYIFTYVKDVAGEAESTDGVPKGRYRIRRCPGFELIGQNYAYNAEPGQKRHIEIIKKGSNLTYKVDGKTLCTATDPNPWNSGYFGFRTWMTELWFDNIVLREL